jgi:hypothetical protein
VVAVAAGLILPSLVLLVVTAVVLVVVQPAPRP